MKESAYPLRAHEIVWIRRKDGKFWPGFITKIRAVQSAVHMYYRFILKGRPVTYCSPVKLDRFRRLQLSDELDDEQKEIPGLVTAFESAKNYLITQNNFKGKDKKAKLCTPMKYFYPMECRQVRVEKPKMEASREPSRRSSRPCPNTAQSQLDPFEQNQPPEDDLLMANLSEELYEIQVRQAKELHDAKMKNEQQYYRESRELYEARIAAVEISTMLSEELHKIEKETALFKAGEAKINQKIALLNLKKVELELERLDHF